MLLVPPNNSTDVILPALLLLHLFYFPFTFHIVTQKFINVGQFTLHNSIMIHQGPVQIRLNTVI